MHQGLAVREPGSGVAMAEFVAQPAEEACHGDQKIRACETEGGEGKSQDHIEWSQNKSFKKSIIIIIIT